MNSSPMSTHFLLGVGYCLAALMLDWLSLIGLYRGIGVTPWSPTTGLALAYAYWAGPVAWPFIAVAELLTLLVVNPTRFSIPALGVVIVATCGTWVAAAVCLRSVVTFDPRLRTVQSLLVLIAVATIGALMHSSAYMLALWYDRMIGQTELFPAAWRLVVGDVVGILIVAPLLLLFARDHRLEWPEWTHLAQFLVLLAALWTVFAYRQATTYQLFYLLFLPLLWVALRDGVRGVILMLNAAQIGIIVGTHVRADIVPGTGSLQILMIALAVTGLLVSAVVTEREAAGQRLREQQAALGRALRLRSAGETAAAIAHQINQPITAISTYAAIARDAIAAGNHELAGTALGKLTHECDRAAEVMRSIRDLVKQGALSPAPMRLARLLEDVRVAHASELGSQRIVMGIEIAPGLPILMADQVQLEQAVDNLVVNSIEAIGESGRPGHIGIIVRAEGDDTIIEVEDSGPGFAPGLDALATTPFMTTKRNGSGLGLAIARSVAEAHGGSLAVMRRSTGACIRIRLPTLGKRNAQSN